MKNNTILYPFRDIIDNQNRILSTESLPSITNPDDNFDITSLSKTNNDCGVANPQEKINFQKAVITENLDRFIRYTSSGGSFCDDFSYSNLPRNKAYLVSIYSRNVKGLPLRICITNYISQRCDLFTHLVSSKDFTKETFLIPPIDEGTGFDININNFSIKNSPSINDLGRIVISVFDYEKLSRIENYSALFPQSKDKNVVIYSQSFNSGWKAYQIKSEKLKVKNWINNVFPFLFGKELKEHVLVNNWANGWIIDSSKLKVKNSKLVIVFWPQYLEYLGFGILIATFSWLIYGHIKKPKKIKLT